MHVDDSFILVISAASPCFVKQTWEQMKYEHKKQKSVLSHLITSSRL